MCSDRLVMSADSRVTSDLGAIVSGLVVTFWLPFPLSHFTSPALLLFLETGSQGVQAGLELPMYCRAPDLPILSPLPINARVAGMRRHSWLSCPLLPRSFCSGGFIPIFCLLSSFTVMLLRLQQGEGDESSCSSSFT